MRNASRFVLCSVLLFSWLFAAGIARADDSLWQTDFAAAQAQAKAEHKYLLLDFTGSDWCPSCIHLKERVFDVPAFQRAASKQFVLVELDFPNKKEQSKELEKQNAELGKQYGYRLEGFPTVLLLDNEGNVITRTGNNGKGPEAYVAHLAELVELHENMTRMRTELAKAQGLERAKLLDRLIETPGRLHNEDLWSMYTSGMTFPGIETELNELKWKIRDERLEMYISSRYNLFTREKAVDTAKLLDWLTRTRERVLAEQEELEAWRKEIPELDPDNAAGLKLKYQLRGLVFESRRLMRSKHVCDGSYDAPKLLTQAVDLPGLSGEQKQWAYFHQATWHSYHFDYLETIACLEKSLAAAPDSSHAGEIEKKTAYYVKQRAEKKAELEKTRAELEKATGEERLKLVTHLIFCSFEIEDEVPAAEKLNWYREYRELMRVEPDNLKGIGEMCEQRLRLHPFDCKQLLHEHFAEQEVICDTTLAKPGLTSDDIQLVYVVKAICCLDRKDFSACLDCTQKGLAADPHGKLAEELQMVRQRAEKGLQAKDTKK